MSEGLLNNSSSITMTLAARDGGQPPRSGRATVTVQLAVVTDTAPRFSQAAYDVLVPEDLVPGMTSHFTL